MSAGPLKICACDDEDLYQHSLRLGLGADFELSFVSLGEALLGHVAAQTPDLVLLDLCLEQQDSGFALLTRLKAAWPQLPVVIHSGLADYQSVVRAMQLGATDYIPKGSPNEQMKKQLKQLAWQSRRARTCSAQEHTQDRVGCSPAMLQLDETIRRIKPYPGNVVIVGESGAGKEWVAHALRRDDAPFVAVDCSTIVGATAESILFGHERGAFTGAERARRGLLEEAHGGAIYFDEIANMPLEVQAKLLRALQEKQITPLGSSRSKQLSFRVICATNRDLEHLCERGEFRHDLLARLNVFVVRVPPLRERLCDIDRLVDHFMSLHHGGSAAVVTQQARRRLRAYSWPGNVRELSNTAQYLLAMSDGGAIDVCHLPLKIAASPGAAVLGEGARGSFAARLRAFESALLRGEYDACAGNVSRMARRLQMDRSSLHQKLIDLEIHSARRPVPRGADA